MLYRIDNFELDMDKFELRHEGAACHVEPLVFDLIRYLAENAGRVVSRDDIIEHVWQGRIVSDTTVSSAIKSARKALGDTGENQTYIRTVRGRGFEFVGAVEKAGNGSVQPIVTIRNDEREPLAQPTLIILPFQSFEGAAELTAIADGLVENLTTILTRVPLLAITSRTASFALRDAAVNIEDIRAKFGAHYMLEGSVQRVGEKIRANVQLIETRNGLHIWAQQFDMADDGEAMINLLHAILPRLEPQLLQAMFNDLRDESGALTARQLLLQAMGLLALKGWHKDSFAEASGLLRRAIELEPGLALAHAYLALILGLGHRVGLLRTSDDVAREAADEADRAMEIDNMDSNVLGLVGCALADVGQAERAVPILKNAVEINPNNGQALASLGSAYMVLGQIEPAIEYLKQGIDISPHDSRLAVWCAVLGIAYLYAGDFEQAREVAEQGCQNNDKTYLPRVVLASALIELGQEDGARKAVGECYRVKPDLSENEITFLIGPAFSSKIVELGGSDLSV